MGLSRELLLGILEAVSPGLSVKETIAQSGSFVFRKRRVWTYNEMIACSMPLPEEISDLSGAVPAKKLLQALKEMPDSMLAVEAVDGKLTFKGKGLTRLAMDDEITLPVHLIERPSKDDRVRLDAEFPDALGMVKECCGKDEGLFTAVHVHIHPDWVEATDTRQIIRYRMKTGIDKPCLIRKESAKHVAEMGATLYAPTENWLHFYNGTGLVMSCQRLTDDYPDLSPYVEVQGEEIKLPKGLAESAKLAEIFSSEDKDHNLLHMEIDQGRIFVAGIGVSGDYSEVRKARYAGPRRSFMIAPGLLRDIIGRMDKAIVSEDKIFLDGDPWTFSSVLEEPPQPKKKKRKKDG